MAFRMANVGGRAVLVDDGGGYHDIERLSGGSMSSDPMAVLGDGPALHDLAGRLGDSTVDGSIAEVTLDAPVPAPQKSYGIGLNYLDHSQEADMELPKNPLVFTKFPSCICGPTADVEMRSDYVDYEGELVAVIGRGGKDIAADDAWDHVIGLSVGQDISDRRAQFAAKPPHFDLGKSFDTFGPMGPVLVSPDGVPDKENLALRTEVNGEVRQQATTADLIFDIPFLIAYLSRITTLVPGDVIWTGTPAGVGAVQNLYLADGDVVTTVIDGIGTMTNRCVRVSDH